MDPTKIVDLAAFVTIIHELIGILDDLGILDALHHCQC